MLRPLLHRIALILAIAGQASMAPAVRVYVEHLPATTVIVERIQRLAASAPRWGHSVERVKTTLIAPSAPKTAQPV